MYHRQGFGILALACVWALCSSLEVGLQKKKEEKHNRLFLLASGWEEASRWKSISLRSLLVIHISGSQGFLCSAVLCASAVVDRKMDVALWTEGGRTKCLVHLIDLVQWSLRRRDSIQQETDA